jgi:AcrR family transcriptional regulator
MSEAGIEGRRERKRRETRTRIADIAMALFKERGFAAVTVDEIAEAADASKPTFFNYFSAKEDVVLAWQDKFAVRLAEAVAERPKTERLTQAIEEAMIAALIGAATPESLALAALIRETPALAARNQAKYVQLEGALVEALLKREPTANPLEVKLLAMMTIGALRIGTEEWHATDAPAKAGRNDFSREIFRALWAALRSVATSYANDRVLWRAAKCLR